MTRICVTGASGFVGQSLCRALTDSNRFVRGLVREQNSCVPFTGIEYVTVGDIGAFRDWSSVLEDIVCVIHCAGSAHASCSVHIL